MNERTKRCNTCDVVKPLDRYPRDAKMRDGHLNRCKACRSKYASELRNRNIEASRAKERARYAANGYRDKKREWRMANPSRVVEYTSRRRALKQASTVGEVDMERVLSSYGHCYLCGYTLSGEIHVDHVIPLSRGGAHSEQNLRPTHARCNLRKSDKLLHELEFWGAWYVPTDQARLLARELPAK